MECEAVSYCGWTIGNGNRKRILKSSMRLLFSFVYGGGAKRVHEKMGRMFMFSDIEYVSNAHICVGLGSQAARLMATGWNGPGSIPVVGRVEIFLDSFV